MKIREEGSSDTEAIGEVTRAAFAGAPHASGTEAAIVEALRDAGALSVSLVAATKDEIVGHVAFSPVRVDGRDIGWFGLGPVSVRPGHQRKGVGSALIEEGLRRLVTRGAAGCVVLGDPGYYARFGFRPEPALRYPGPPPEYFQALVLAGAKPQGEVAYHPAFGVG